MDEELKLKFINKIIVYQRIFIVLAFLSILLIRLLGFSDNTIMTGVICSVCVAIFLMNEIIIRHEFENNVFYYNFVKVIELVGIAFVEIMYYDAGYIVAFMAILNVVVMIDFILEKSDFDKDAIFFKKIGCLFIGVVAGYGTINRMSEYEWVHYIIVVITQYISVFFIVDWFMYFNRKYTIKMNEQKYVNSKLEDANQSLVEYRDKIKSINEQINYQKIDLAFANKKLEQINAEINSQSDIMKYLASTFDVLKCINYITESVVEVKKTKLCALYVDKNVYYNEYSGCIIKTNYTSLQRRLKKEISIIYEFYKKSWNESVTLSREELSGFKFIEGTNIDNVAIIPLLDGRKVNGMLIIGSDDEEFFKDGLDYYESCMIEFNIAIKSTILYLKVEDMSKKDGLTGIYNRLYFNQLFKKNCEAAKKKREPLSVALFDIDKFKSVNDTYGHLAGDEVIKFVSSVADTLSKEYGGYACRYGGEEFLVILPSTNYEVALSLLESMHEKIRTTPVKYGDVEISVNVCIGLSEYPTLCDSPELLVSRADKAMYFGKNNGRGRLVLDNADMDKV